MESMRVRITDGVYAGNEGTVTDKKPKDDRYAYVDLDHEGFDEHNPVIIKKEHFEELD